jgi:DNA modification methylase
VIVDNVHDGDWDTDILANVWQDSDALQWVDIKLPNVDFNIGGGEDDFEAKDEYKIRVVKGDLFEFRKEELVHRLMCGDSTDKDSYEKLFVNDLADLYLSDPPYGVSYVAKNKMLNSIGKGNRIQVNIENDHLPPDEMYAFWVQVFSMACNRLSAKGSYYLFSPQGGVLLLLLQAVKDSGFQLKHTLIWAKNNHVLGRCDYNYKHEPIVFGWKENGTHEFFGKGDQLTSVWNYDKPLKNDLHPTMKPIEVLQNAILNSTKKGMLVHDNFAGSNSTMVASHQLERNCYAMELDERYVQVGIDRMLKLDDEIELFRNGKDVTKEYRDLLI